LTVKVEVPSSYKKVSYTINGEYRMADTFKEGNTTYAYIDAVPNGAEVAIDGEHNEHVWQGYEPIDESEHACLCPCGSTKLAPHSWNDGETVTPATHTAKGEMLYTCVDCGHTKTAPIDKTKDHTFDQQKTTAKYMKSAASCTERAVYYYSCLCGEKGEETFEYGSEPSGHEFSEWYTTEEMTFTEAEVKEHECTKCGETEEKFISPLTPIGAVTVLTDALIGRKGATQLILSLFLKRSADEAPPPVLSPIPTEEND
jgi:Zn ribbon nucleic-acid-binding protein